MRSELDQEGVQAWFVAVNKADAVANQAALIKRCSYPILQDTEEVQAWTSQFGGGKDDLFVYGPDGALAYHLPAAGTQSTDLSSPDSYKQIKGLIVDLAKTAPAP